MDQNKVEVQINVTHGEGDAMQACVFTYLPASFSYSADWTIVALHLTLEQVRSMAQMFWDTK